MQTEKDNALARCSISQRAWAAKKPMPCLHAVTDEEGRPLDDEDESGTRSLYLIGVAFFELRTDDERHHARETVLHLVQQASEDIQWTINEHNKEGNLLLTHGIPHSVYRCAGGLGSPILV